MPVLFRVSCLAGASLLAGLAGCQRASYSFQPPAPAASILVPDSARPVAGVAKLVETSTQARVRSISCRYYALPRAVAQHLAKPGRSVAPPATPHVTFLPMAAKHQRRAGFTRRTFTTVAQALGGDVGFHFLFLGGGLLASSGGLVLAFGVGGWLAVIAGVAAIGGGLYLLLIWLFGQGQRGR